jgi:hypothetical protein
VEAAGFRRVQRVCAAAWVEASMPEGFGGIDVADSGDVRLIEQKFLEGALRRHE